MRDTEERDQIDRLYARLDSFEPPDDFLQRVLVRAREGEVARWAVWQRVAFGILYVVALVGLAVLAFMTGSAMENAHARELITIALQDLSSVKDSPGIYLSAIADALPWSHLLAVAIDLLVLAVATRLLLRTSAPARARRGPAPA